MKTGEGIRERYMRLLYEKTRELGRKVTFAEVAEDPKLPAPNSYSFYTGSFSNAAEEAWAKVQAELRRAQTSSPTAKTKVVPVLTPAAGVPTEVEQAQYDEALEQALAVCEGLQRVSRKKEVWRARTDFGKMLRILGRGDFQRLLRVVQDAWDKRHLELKRPARDILSLEELEWTKEGWLKWMQSFGREDYRSVDFWSLLSKQYTLQYQRILYVFGNWTQALAEFEKFLKTQADVGEGPMTQELRLETMQKAETTSATQQYDAEVVKEILRKMTEALGFVPDCRCYKKLSVKFDAPPYEETKRLVGKYTKWPEILGEPYESMVRPTNDRTKPVTTELEKGVAEMAEITKEVVEKVASSEEVTPKATLEGESPKARKKRVNMTPEEMRAYVVEAIKVLGDCPSSEQYNAYMEEHGGVGLGALRKHGLGLQTWRAIAAQELSAEPGSKAEELEVSIGPEIQVKPEVPVEPEKQAEPKKAEPESKTPMPTLDLSKLMQIMVHGIDATVTIDGLEVQVRLDFGSKG